MSNLSFFFAFTRAGAQLPPNLRFDDQVLAQPPLTLNPPSDDAELELNPECFTKNIMV